MENIQYTLIIINIHSIMLQDQSYIHNKKYWKPGSDDIHPHTASIHITQEMTTHI
jgi:hypothetical protein